MAIKHCTVDGCERPYCAAGLCRRHYMQQWERNGSNGSHQTFNNIRAIWGYLSQPGNACATLATIVKDTGIPRHSVVYALKRLKQIGHIEHDTGAKNARRVVTPFIEARRP